MKKTIKFGKIDFYGRGRRINEVDLDVELRDTDKGPEFSVCGDVWNGRRTDIVCGGQCLDDLKEFLGGNGLFEKIHRLWKAYHLNGMHTGTPEQENWLKAHRTWRSDYDKDCECLKKAGLYEVDLDGKKYRYGTAWLYWPIPAEDLAEIREILAG